MLRKLFLVLIGLVLLCGIVEAREIYVTSNTVSFNSAISVMGGRIITFSTVINKILLVNESASEAIRVEFDGYRIGWIQTDNTVKVFYYLPNSNDFRIDANSSISLDVSTDKIGVTPNSATGSGTFRYIATSDRRVSDNSALNMLSWTDL